MEMHVHATLKVLRLSLMLMPADSCMCVSLSHFLFSRAFRHQQLSASLSVPEARRRPDTPPSWRRKLLHLWAALWPKNQKIKRCHQWKVMKNTSTITQSWSNVHCGITDDWCNWHCITNLTYSTEANDSFPAHELKTLESLNIGQRWHVAHLIYIGRMTLKIHGDNLCRLVHLEFSLIRQGEKGWWQIENNCSDYSNIGNVR